MQLLASSGRTSLGSICSPRLAAHLQSLRLRLNHQQDSDKQILAKHHWAPQRSTFSANSTLDKQRRRYTMAAKVEVPSLVEPSWLNDRLQDPDVKILDGSWHMADAGRNPEQEFQQERIPGSQFFDMHKVSDLETSLPHMLPKADAFASVMDSLGIEKSHTVVIYDRAGIFSAPRIWWTFRAFGHESVAVLNGGYPAWKAAKFEVETTSVSDADIHKSAQAAANLNSTPHYPANLQENLVRDREQVLGNVSNKKEAVVDARGGPRFEGKAAEPRQGMRSGHIPGSTNVHYAKILQDGRYKDTEQLKQIFGNAGIDWKQPVTTTCGSGVTACILALGLYQVDPSLPVAVYDGSWY